MSRRSPLDFDISVTADKRRRARQRGMTGKVESAERRCQWPGCTAPAFYRAPESPESLHRFRWFCLDHVREYNKSWNFFENAGEAAVEAQAEADRVWDRPTWRMDKGPKAGRVPNPHSDGDAWARWGFADPFTVLGDNATLNPGRAPGDDRPRRRRLQREEQMALDTLGLPHQVEARKDVRARYTELVKQLHPDMNGGAAVDAKRLERVLKAWTILKRSRNFSD
ncbi:MAG: J domain-containing protein [Pseudomonadota bacterium]